MTVERSADGLPRVYYSRVPREEKITGTIGARRFVIGEERRTPKHVDGPRCWVGVWRAPGGDVIRVEAATRGNALFRLRQRVLEVLAG